MQRLNRVEKREQTRERLRESAARAFAAQGVGAASVDFISESAGYSRGAFYANYETKEELLLELMARMLDSEADAWRKLAADAADVEEMLDGFAKRFKARSRESQWSMLAAELQLHAQREPVFGRAYVACLRKHHAAVTDLFEAIFAKAGRVPPAEPQALAAAAMAFGNALSLQATEGVRRGDTQYATKMFMLYLRGLIAVAEPVRATSRPRGART